MIDDYSPVMVDSSQMRPGFALVSCMSTLVTITICKRFAQRTGEDKVQLRRYIKSIIGNLNSEIEDLKQYTVVLISKLIKDKELKKEFSDVKGIVEAVDMYLDSGCPTLKYYTCKVISKCYYRSAIEFNSTFPGMLIRILNVAEKLDSPKHICKVLQYVNDLAMVRDIPHYETFSELTRDVDDAAFEIKKKMFKMEGVCTIKEQEEVENFKRRFYELSSAHSKD